jgi:hypothetical protein
MAKKIVVMPTTTLVRMNLHPQEKLSEFGEFADENVPERMSV